jgi:hypothetical protein
MTPNENEIAGGAEILQQLLTDMSLAETGWPAFVGLAPAKPDEMIICYDTAGLDQGQGNGVRRTDR